MLFANCILVKGYNRSAIYDLHRGTIQMVPNDLYNLFINGNTINVVKLLKTINIDSDKEIVLEYLEFLEKEDYGFYGDKNILSFYKDINTKYNYPFTISNILIDIALFNPEKLKAIIKQIDENNIRNVEIRVFNSSFSLEKLDQLHELIKSSNIKHLSLVLPFNNFKKAIKSDFCKFRFSQIVFYNCENDDSFEDNGIKVFYSKEKDLDQRACGLIDMKYFSVNIPTFTEALNHNSCLNRKISIDINGNIKNCPSMKASFGNIGEITLGEALRLKEIKKNWDITKDQINVCKDCEFRYACIDCRAYVEDPDDIYSKPLKCGYDPYTNTWEEWSINPLKQKAIEYYDMQDLVKNNN